MKGLKSFLFGTTLLLFLSGCSTYYPEPPPISQQESPPAQEEPAIPSKPAQPPSTIQEKTPFPPPQPTASDEEIVVEPFIPEDVSSLSPHPAVQRVIETYTTTGREKFQRGLDRLAPVYEEVAGHFREGNLPENTLFLGMVESTFKIHARSRVGAFGPWQFMASTGRLYGLKVTPFVDERASWDKATRASVRLLNDLFDEFHSMELALAAYNAGKGNVRRALKRCRRKGKDFWSIRRCLPRETRNFVPSVLAAMTIGKDLETYGFSLPDPPADPWETVSLPTAVDLRRLAKHLGIDKKTFLLRNPTYVTGYTPLSGGEISVPLGRSSQIPDLLSTHTVRRGETLTSIAKQFRVSTSTLRRINNLTARTALPKGTRLIVPELPKRTIYRVRRGDSLWSISRKFRVPLSKLLAANGLSRRSRIYPKQKIIVPGRGYRSSSSGFTYRVRRGDTLYSIARRFGTSVKRLKRINGLHSNIIRPGERLLIR